MKLNDKRRSLLTSYGLLGCKCLLCKCKCQYYIKKNFLFIPNECNLAGLVVQSTTHTNCLQHPSVMSSSPKWTVPPYVGLAILLWRVIHKSLKANFTSGTGRPWPTKVVEPKKKNNVILTTTWTRHNWWGILIINNYICFSLAQQPWPVKACLYHLWAIYINRTLEQLELGHGYPYSRLNLYHVAG